MNLLYTITHSFLRILFRVLYRHHVKGANLFIKGPAIIAPNHISFLDPPLVAVSCPEPVAFLARDTLFKKPLFGALIRRLNAYPVSGKIKDLSSIKVVLSVLKKRNKVIIFPEGIRSYDGDLTDIKPGICMIAMRADVPVIPVYIKGTFEIWDRQRKFPKLWGNTLCIFGEPIFPATFKDLDKKSAQEAMALEIKKSILSLKEQAD